MVHTYVIGDREFYRDAERTQASIAHLMLEAIDDMEQTIAGLARKFAPGRLGVESVGTDPAHVVSPGLYKGVVGVRRTPKHAKYVHEGTGIYGPLHRPFTIHKKQTNIGPNWGRDRTGRLNPAVGNVFKIPVGSGGGYMIDGKAFMFRKSITVMGEKPQPFLTEAYEVAIRSEVPARVTRLARRIAR